ncbi:MAG: TonB-dependent receptor [Myxococcaceae bacterium]|nr:TonB-dependent receptor [Myxococcaceae bacterium]
MRRRAGYVALWLWGMLGHARAQPTPIAPGAEPVAWSRPDEEYGAVATATRIPRPISNVPAIMTVLRRAELDQNPALGTDGVLRSLPSVATFRRSSSLTADPSAQGLNLRGVGPSGVSRTLVLVDGVPANDPFGGSIYWRSLPRIGIDKIEVVPGGGSALYGSAALSGVVQLFSRPLTRSFEADALYGSLQTMQLDARGAYAFGKVAASIEGEYLRSDGFRVVAADQAGPIDRPAASSHLTLHARSTLQATKALSFTTGMRLFHQEQNGGTRFTNSEVQLAQLSLEGALALRKQASVSLLLFGRLQRFEQDRARVAMGRTSELLAGRQNVPADDQGASLVYKSPILSGAGQHVLSTGADARRVHGVSRERLYSAQPTPEALRKRDAGGEQLLSGVFVQDLWTVSSQVELSAALRADFWQNRSAASDLLYESGTQQHTAFQGRTAYALSPRVGALYRPLELLALRGSLYRAFRAPTLNELYRPFQVGTVLTDPNPKLGPELLHGFEAGIELTPLPALVMRATGFWNRLDGPITNVTLAAPLDDGATRVRENLGFALVRGLETSIEHRLSSSLTTIVSYTLAASSVRSGGSGVALRGKRLAQDPVHRGSLLLLFDRSRWLTASLQVRAIGAQYEDDLNTLRMKPFAVVDLFASRRLFWNLELFAAVENLLNVTYLTGRAGVDTVGQPLVARGGLRIRAPRP